MRNGKPKPRADPGSRCELRRHGARVVVAALGEVEHLAAPGEQPQAGEAHGRTHHIADQGLESAVISGRDVDGVMDGEAQVIPPMHPEHEESKSS
jgi:hypothetical protein